MKRALLVVAAALASPRLAAALPVELLQNGSFEQPVSSTSAGNSAAPPWQFMTRYERNEVPPVSFPDNGGEWRFGPQGIESPFPYEQTFPSDGNQFALFFPFARGDFAMTQQFVVPLDASWIVASIDVLAWAGPDVSDVGTCDFYGTLSNSAECGDTPGITGARVDVIRGGAAALAGFEDVVAQIVITSAGLSPEYATFSVDLTGLVAPGETYQFRISAALDFGRVLLVDRASVIATPEPASSALAGSALLALALARRQRRSGVNARR